MIDTALAVSLVVVIPVIVTSPLPVIDTWPAPALSVVFASNVTLPVVATTLALPVELMSPLAPSTTSFVAVMLTWPLAVEITWFAVKDELCRWPFSVMLPVPFTTTPSPLLGTVMLPSAVKLIDPLAVDSLLSVTSSNSLTLMLPADGPVATLSVLTAVLIALVPPKAPLAVIVATLAVMSASVSSSVTAPPTSSVMLPFLALRFRPVRPETSLIN